MFTHLGKSRRASGYSIMHTDYLHTVQSMHTAWNIVSHNALHSPSCISINRVGWYIFIYLLVCCLYSFDLPIFIFNTNLDNRIFFIIYNMLYLQEQFFYSIFFIFLAIVLDSIFCTISKKKQHCTVLTLRGVLRKATIKGNQTKRNVS